MRYRSDIVQNNILLLSWYLILILQTTTTKSFCFCGKNYLSGSGLYHMFIPKATISESKSPTKFYKNSFAPYN